MKKLGAKVVGMLPVFRKWLVLSPWNKSDTVMTTFSSMESVFELKGEIISKSSQSEIFSYDINGKEYFVKRYFRSKRFGSWLGFSRFRVETKNQLWFNSIGINAARVVVYGEEYFLGKTIRGILITEGIGDVTDLAVIAKNTPEKFENTMWRNTVISQLANIVAKLHYEWFCHNDLHWRNILIQETAEDSIPKIFLIDCPSGKQLFWPLLHRRQLKDLVSLDKLAPNYLTRTQRLRFFMEYRNISTLSNSDKRMIKELLDYKELRVRRKERK